MQHIPLRAMGVQDFSSHIQSAINGAAYTYANSVVSDMIYMNGGHTRSYLNGEHLNTRQEEGVNRRMNLLRIFIDAAIAARAAEMDSFWLGTREVQRNAVYINGEHDVDGGEVRITTSTERTDSTPIQIGLRRFSFELQDGSGEDEASTVIFEPVEGNATFMVARPTPELMATVPESVARYTTRTVMASQAGQVVPVYQVLDDGSTRIVRVPGSNGTLTGERLIADARVAHREIIRARLNSSFSSVNAEQERIRREHRERTAQNYARFVQSRTPETERHVGTLPFVPHGLSSSLRWGIEVESGGARGVDQPDGWRRVSDGSLRSAYDGYTEVQDFEPYDEERTVRTSWVECTNAGNHQPRTEIWDGDRDEYLYVMNPEYIDPRECAHCGTRQETVRVMPQTIRHRAEGGDCAEFVSPILVSMHSAGLKYLCDELSKRPQNASAGVHVHVEASHLSASQLATLVYGYDLLEPILEASYQRENRQYCNRRNANDVLMAARQIGKESFEAEAGSRYVTLNTHSLSRHGTVEFRAMGPVYDYDYLVRWAMLCRELVNAVGSGATNRDFARVKNWNDVLSLISRFGKEYVRAAVFEMTGETGTAPALLKADQPVTTAALNTDFTAVVNSMSSMGISMGSFASQVTGAFSRLSEMVGVDGRVEV